MAAAAPGPAAPVIHPIPPITPQPYRIVAAEYAARQQTNAPLSATTTANKAAITNWFQAAIAARAGLIPAPTTFADHWELSRAEWIEIVDLMNAAGDMTGWVYICNHPSPEPQACVFFAALSNSFHINTCLPVHLSHRKRTPSEGSSGTFVSSSIMQMALRRRSMSASSATSNLRATNATSVSKCKISNSEL